MQKVSKQSLAMLALSILLAISIALTFTFAALAAEQKTVNGTITFQGNVAIELGEGFVSESGNTYTISLTATDTGITIPATATIGLTSNSVNAYMKVVVTALQGDNATSGAVTMSKATEFASGWTGELVSGFTSSAKIVAGSNIALDDLIAFTVDLDKMNGVENVTFTITIDAQVGQFA